MSEERAQYGTGPAAGTPRSIFRIVKGAPFTVLVALMHLGGEAGVVEICNLTTYTDKTVNRALDALADAGLVANTHRYNGWILTKHGKQIPFVLVGAHLPGAGEFLRLGEIPPVVNVVKDLKTESFNSIPTTTAPEISPARQARLDALRSAGVEGRVRDELAADPDLTPEYIAGVASKTKAERLGTGMLVTRLRSHDELPPEWREICPECGGARKHHAEGCQRGYFDSPLADFIER